MSRSFAPSDMQIWLQFDKALPVDDSGKGRHLVGSTKALAPLNAGPGVMGKGASARLDGTTILSIPGAPEGAEAAAAMNSPSITITLWIYLLQDSVGAWRTIFSRGTRAEELLPALLIAPYERRLHVRATSRAEGTGGSLDASGLLPLKRWTHVAVVVTCGVLRLYINGVNDGEMILEGPLEQSVGDLFIGRDPWRAGTQAFLDDFRWYSRELPPEELRAMIFPSLTGAAASDAISLGCDLCRFPEATRVCERRNAHVCSLQEHFSGGFHTARAMGWITSKTEFWHHDATDDEIFNGMRKMALCCLD